MPSGLDLDSLNPNDFGRVVRIVIFRQVIKAKQYDFPNVRHELIEGVPVTVATLELGHFT